MKRFFTENNGGLPFVLDDLRWIESGNIEALKALITPYLAPGQTQLILSGCEVTEDSGDLVVSEGYIYIDGEIYHCPVSSVLDEGLDHQFFSVEVLIDPAGDKVFQTTNTFSTYHNRVAVLSQDDDLPAGSVDISEVKTLQQRVYEMMGLVPVIPWTDLPGASYDYPTDEGRAQYMRDKNGVVYFRGIWSHEDPSSAPTLGTLPVECRPSVDIKFHYVYPVVGPVSISIKAATGIVKIVDSVAPQEVKLSSFPPFHTL